MGQDSTDKTNKYISNPFVVIFRGFDKLFRTNQTWAIIVIVVGLLTFFWNAPASTSGSSTSNSSVSAAIIALIVAASLIFACVTVVLFTFYRGAVAYVTLKTIEGKQSGVKEALIAAREKFWTILWIQVIVGLKVLGGLILFIIPGVRAILRYNMVYLPVFKSNKNGKQAIAEMKNLTKDHLIEIFGMEIASGIIPLVGPALGVGGQVIIYPQLTELKRSGAPKPPVHWLNYLGVLLISLFLLLVIFIAIALVSIIH